MYTGEITYSTHIGADKEKVEQDTLHTEVFTYKTLSSRCIENQN